MFSDIGETNMTTMRDGTNYYEILEVAAQASQTDIHKAYQRAKATYSQDNPALYSMFSREEARELLRMIEEAYSILGNATLRKSYDDARSGAAAPAGPVNTSSMKSNSTTPSKAMHHNLPDFGEPEDARAADDAVVQMGGFMIRKKDSNRPTLPPGTGATSLSTYKLDENYEREVADFEDFSGPVLQKIRLYKNISVDKLSDATRISRTYLMAVETNDYKQLPAAVFVRGFIVQIARVIGINETKAAASYMKHFKAGGGK